MYTAALLYSQLSVQFCVIQRCSSSKLSKVEQDMEITLWSRVSLSGAGSPCRGQWLLLVLPVPVHCLGMQPPCPADPRVTFVVLLTVPVSVFDRLVNERARSDASVQAHAQAM